MFANRCSHWWLLGQLRSEKKGAPKASTPERRSHKGSNPGEELAGVYAHNGDSRCSDDIERVTVNIDTRLTGGSVSTVNPESDPFKMPVAGPKLLSEKVRVSEPAAVESACTLISMTGDCGAAHGRFGFANVDCQLPNPHVRLSHDHSRRRVFIKRSIVSNRD